MSHLESMILIATFFLILTSSYGLPSSLPDVQTATNVIFAAWPSPNFPPINTNCGSLDFGCMAGSAQTAAAYPGLALFYGFSLLFSVLSRVNAFFTIFQILIFGGAFSAGGTPVLGLVMGALILIAMVEVFRIARGNPSGT